MSLASRGKAVACPPAEPEPAEGPCSRALLLEEGEAAVDMVVVSLATDVARSTDTNEEEGCTRRC